MTKKFNVTKNTNTNTVVIKPRFVSMNVSSWNSPRDNLAKAKWTENMINAMLPDIHEFIGKDVPQAKYKALMSTTNSDGHSGNTFGWTFNVARQYCIELGKTVSPTDSYVREIITKNIDSHVETLVGLMQTNMEYWRGKPITIMYNGDFIELIRKAKVLDSESRDEQLLGYIYFKALSKLHDCIVDGVEPSCTFYEECKSML